MTNDYQIQNLKSRLFADEEARTYAILDGAAVPDLLSVLYLYQPECECLYRGELAPDMAEVAPYIVQLEPGHDFTNWLLKNGFGENWGIFAVSPADLRAMRLHFRRFLMVYDSENKPLYFRYYDPRVLRIYLPTCNAEELGKVFGPVNSFFVGAENPDNLLQFHVSSGVLSQEEFMMRKPAIG